MALTAREWILLPKEEQEARKDELSEHECFLLRTELDFIHFTEEEKKHMSEERRYNFTHPKDSTLEEKNMFNSKATLIFETMSKESKVGKENMPYWKEGMTEKEKSEAMFKYIDELLMKKL